MNQTAENLAAARDLRRATITVVLPVFNEAAALPTLVRLLTESLETAVSGYELLFVNDGSTDETAEVLRELSAVHPGVRVLQFSRNFGHQAAVQAGLERAGGDAVILMDSDLQDDPGCLPEFLRAWEQGADVVYAVRVKRKEHPVKRALFYSFYRVLNCLTADSMPMDAGNFSLMDRSVVQAICRMPESDRYFPGLRHWVGFRQQGVVVERLERHDEQPRVTLWQLFRLAKAAIFGFSTVPLAIFYLLGGASMLVCVGASLFCLYHRLVTQLAIPGWTSITISASFFGAINSLGIAILGEYVVRIYDQVRQRPAFIIADSAGGRENACFAPTSSMEESSAVDSEAVESIREALAALADCRPEASGASQASSSDRPQPAVESAAAASSRPTS